MNKRNMVDVQEIRNLPSDRIGRKLCYQAEFLLRCGHIVLAKQRAGHAGRPEAKRMHCGQCKPKEASSSFVLTAEYLRECVCYFPDTGEMKWLARPRAHFISDHAMDVWNKRFAGKAAGGKPDQNGYHKCSINYISRPLHKLAWLYVTGLWPIGEIDHKDRNRANNRWANLRDVDHQENSKNSSMKSTNTSGHVGVFFDKRTNRWQASITVDGKTKFLGRFNEIECAIAVRKQAQKLHGFSDSHGEIRPT